MASIPRHHIELVALTAAMMRGLSTEDDVRAALDRCGLPERTVDELVAFVPIAFGRRILRSAIAHLPETFIALDDPKGRRVTFRYDERALYRAAADFAEHSDRDLIGAVMRWSCELDVVNQAAAQGSDLAKLRLTETLAFLPHLVVSRPLSFRPPDDGSSSLGDWHGIGRALGEWLTAHGVKADRTDASVFRTASTGTFEVGVFTHDVRPHRTSLQVDLVAKGGVLGGDRQLIASAGGFGTDPLEAARDAFATLCMSSLHVLTAALVDRSVGGDQVEWETWTTADGSSWDVCMGALAVHASDPASVNISPFLDLVRDAFSQVGFDRTVPHWISVFALRSSKFSNSEVLLDGEPWAEMERALDGQSFPTGSGMLRARMFLVALPRAESNVPRA